MMKSKIIGLIASTADSIKDKLLSLPKNIIRIIIWAVVTIVLTMLFFIFRDGLYLFRLAKDKITK